MSLCFIIILYHVAVFGLVWFGLAHDKVLEDYIIQNIQLKDGVETLGNEIARLNQQRSQTS